MAETTDLEALFLENLPLIDRIAPLLARRNGIAGEEGADFVSWVKLRIVENEYAVLRKFRGESAVGTYLTVVIAMLARDYRVQLWGRWRPSAAARRAGPVAVRLESLVRRQGYALSQAGELLRASGGTDLSDRELGALLSQIPVRPMLRPIDVGPEPLSSAESATRSDVLVAEDEADRVRRRTWRLLSEAIAQHTPEDRLVLRMRFWDELSVADIARALSLDQKPLYKRIDRLLADLRRRLTRAGVTREQYRDLLEGTDA
jgi:RNA polymerase sigma factor (sigma-70 family)